MLNFLIMAFVIFCLVKRHEPPLPEEGGDAAGAPAPPTRKSCSLRSVICSRHRRRRN
ncbi:MAG: hypothetical protein ACLRWQ_01675 [Flavonifractor plautii]